MSEYKFKEVMSKPERLAPGHRMCAGCGATIAVRAVLRALHEGDQAVIGNATGWHGTVYITACIGWISVQTSDSHITGAIKSLDRKIIFIQNQETAHICIVSNDGSGHSGIKP